MVKKILCRADGNAITGLGHLYRMFAIAAFYIEDYDLIFLTQSTSLISIIPNDYKIELIPKNINIKDEPKCMAKKFNPSEYIIIADGYQFISSYQKALKNFGYTLVYIDDLATEHMYADIVINHSLDCNKNNFIAEAYTKYALGTKYAILRPKFNEAAKLKRNISNIENAFVCFGGVDKYDLSLKALTALLKSNWVKKINVVLGGAYTHQKIYDLANMDERVCLYKNLDEVSLCKIMQSCQIAIAPSSTIVYELCSVKMLVLSGYFAENQKKINESLTKKKAIFNGGNFKNYSVIDFEKQITMFLNNLNVETYISKQQELFDGKNKNRFLSLLNQLHITCRKATKEDLTKVYDWSNDKLVRENSYFSEPIELKNHTNWFLKKIKNPNILFLIVEVNKKPAGIVRYDITDVNAVVGILVSKTFRGQKLASRFLEEGTKLYIEKYKKPILAYIKKENIASLKSFENAKYVYYKEETRRGSSSFVYKLEKKNVFR